MCLIPDDFRDTAISLYVPKLLIRKRYYVLFLIPEFIVQVTQLVQFTVNINVFCNSPEDMMCYSSVQSTVQ
jgi:hypothetical protein